MKRRTFLTASLGGMTLAASGCAPSGLRLHSGAALAFGTTVSVSVLHDDAAVAQRAIDAALAQAAHVDRLMSIYDPASQVWQLNRDGRLDHPHADLLAVLRQAQALSALTRGAFDITVQPLWQAFRQAADVAALPDAAQLRQSRAKVGWKRVVVDAARIRLVGKQVAITLNGLAQGYAADLALAAVRAHGIDHALLDTGEFTARGRNRAGHDWTIGVADPRESDRMAAIVRLDGRSLATSGDYASAFTPDFAHHHIFDPATGDSPTELASVSVVAPSAMLADGLSTAFMVMGAKKSHALAATLDRVDLMTINKRGVVWRSPGFALEAA
jgi:thiamine biosynthesis lipoprotein